MKNSNFSANSLREKFESLQKRASGDPLLNPVSQLASDIFLGLEDGSVSKEGIIEAIRLLELESFETRAKEFHSRRNPVLSRLRDALHNVRELGFERFKQRVEKCATGIVFTAHPTFALGVEKRNLIASYPYDGDEKAIASWRQEVARVDIDNQTQITLRYEHGEAQKAISNAQNAILELNRAILMFAQQSFPEQWRLLTPNPISVASWVGYDLDGRTDIHWGESIRIRLVEKAAQLARYESSLNRLCESTSNIQLEKIRGKIVDAHSLSKKQAEAFDGDFHDVEFVVQAANLLTHGSADPLVSLSHLVEELTEIIKNESNADLALECSLLRSEMISYGLGVSRIHLRVNAAQVRSALKSDLGLDPDRDFTGRSALDIASKKVETAKRRAVSFGSVFLEKMTARRQFMLCAQILKHVDVETPIRFLIAECEAPATVMGAIYLARLYGVDQKIDISPLFETPQAMESGGRFLERLLDEPEYCKYVKARKRMSIQIGFSDSGRFIGQCTASLAIERLQVLFAKALGKASLGDVEALVFNTHGESMGRGAHPGNFRERQNHLATPWVRSRFRKENVTLHCECSFQGGEGFLHFQTPEVSQDTVNMLWEQATEELPPDVSDRFYSDINFSWDFYRGLKSWQEALYSREDYRALLFAFPQNLLYKTGSRETKRATLEGGVPEIRSMRAIPHNAVLQQLAIPANVSGGVGIASGREIERLIEHVDKSSRMQELIKMVLRARSLTSISVMRAYAGTFAPAYWSSLAGNTHDLEFAERYETVLQALLQHDISGSIDRLANFLSHDLRTTDVLRRKLSDTNTHSVTSCAGLDLTILHALRQAMIAHSISLVASVPEFSRRHDVSKHDLIDMALMLRLHEVTGHLREIFPKESLPDNAMTALKEIVDDGEEQGGAYPEVHRDIIEPLESAENILRSISIAVSNSYQAYG
ncbi:MAG: hypothetical protein DHS20C05_10920 [Hyphococcus sp.]|nr:MAG: hypothetical protein DHS20C05_10920 [Marinicaulis sp.]